MSEPLRRIPADEPAPESGSGSDPGLAARREHSLRSLLELSRELKVSLDLYETADLLLFNLMGQFGTARSAMWLFTGDKGARSVMVRCHGFKPQAVSAVTDICADAVRRRLAREPSPMLSWALKPDLGTAEFELIRQVGIALFAPLSAHGELLGLLALGARVNGTSYTDDNLQTLETALGMVGMSLQNTRLYNRLFENNRQLRLSHDRLLEHTRLKSEFLSNVNHELRTPLAVIIGTLECIVDHRSTDEDLKGLVQGGLKKSHDLRGMIENLLILADATEGRLEVQIEAGTLGPVLEAFHAERLAGVSETLREFRFEPGGDLPGARFDRKRLLQILNELVDNAVKFTPSGARLVLRTSRLEENDRRWVGIEVSDNGPGIPADRLENLFRSFEQVDGSSTRRVGGLGVGLAFARQLAERMNGELRVRSDVGAGSTFTLLLPAA
ncbi:MAG TPA: ATP-binding protein [Candidatus Limnocylindria bacterium]|nr:ATP-binding protein [Candidatus Limnocylindria bacterium]